MTDASRRGMTMAVALRLAAVVVLAAGASACSSVPNWAKPTTWYDSVVGGSSSAPSQSDVDSGAYPTVDSVPDRPQPNSTADERRQIASALVADRSRANYSAEALRGGTEPAAAPPPARPVMAALPNAEATRTMTAARDASPVEHNAAPAPMPSEDVQVATVAPPPASAPVATTSMAAPAPTPVSIRPSDAPPAVPANTVIPGAQAGMLADAPLGFKASSAPALDPTVAQFVPPSILARYQETRRASVYLVAPHGAVPVRSATPAAYAPGRTAAMESGNGSVQVNLAAIQSGYVPASVPGAAMGGPSIPIVGQPATVVFFGHGSTALDGAAQSRVRAAAVAYRAGGNARFVRVVGHASSRTGDMPLAQHLTTNFKASQDRASAVAQELIRQGVPANVVIVEAAGDTQPVYYESMPEGEDGNRRAEIFFEG